MSETGGPVYEGSGKPEKASLGDRVKTKTREAFADFRNKGEFVEKKWMNSYQKVVDALDDGKRKQALEKIRPAAIVVAKANRIGSAVVDVALRWVGLKNMFAGIVRMVAPKAIIDIAGQTADEVIRRGREPSDFLWDSANMSAEDMRKMGKRQGAKGIVQNIGGRASVARRVSGWMADIAGFGGEKVAKISNKILRGKPVATAV